MARPKLYAQHFVACRRVEWIGTPGPNTARVLDGVSYTYGGRAATKGEPDAWRRGVGAEFAAWGLAA
jgi:hypothetical protein